LPGKRSRRVNEPSALEFLVVAMLVSWLTTVTLASGMADPVESTTVPSTTAVAFCADNGAAAKHASNNETTAVRGRFVTVRPPDLGTLAMTLTITEFCTQNTGLSRKLLGFLPLPAAWGEMPGLGEWTKMPVGLG
jgi:hypothetical protein